MKYFRILYFMFLLFVLNTNINAQKTKQIFRDDFNNNVNNWKQNEFSKIKNGTLNCKCSNEYLFRVFLKEINLNYKKDYSIEARIKETTGKNTSSFGIIWGASSWKNSLIFRVSNTGEFEIYGYKNGEKFNINNTSWGSKTNNIAKISSNFSYNKLSVKKVGNNMLFYINDLKVFKIASQLPYGYFIGVVAGQNSKIAVDYLQVNAQMKTINLLGQGISKYSKKNMGLSINSPYSEIAPVVAPDGKTLWLARAKHPLNEKPIKNYDIWYSTLSSSGKWAKMKKAPKPLNNSGDNVVISVTPDNNTLFLETLYNSDGSFKSDQGISVSHRTASGWTIPQKINITNYYNKNIYESFAFTGDRHVLVMSVERNDTYGDKDMYVSFLQADGSYSKPKNMGNVLNSYLGEGTPYIAPDGKTLYFYSMTEPGYGDADIFVSKRLDDTWTKWTTPKNLGKKINSNQWDVYYTVAAKGDYAYLVSSKSSFGNEDIFTIKLRDEEKPDPVVIVYGKVIDAKTKHAIQASVVYENRKTGKIEGRARSNPKTGEYKIVLTYGEKYNIRAKKDGYFAMNETINLTSKKSYKEVKKNLLMSPLNKEEPILLKDVNFYSTKAKLLPTAYPEINRLIILMKKNPNIIIELHGHTEKRAGYEKQLYKLSEERAEAVKKYMMIKGIDKQRIKMKAFGGTKPLISNDTEDGRKQNRRVEFKILQK